MRKTKIVTFVLVLIDESTEMKLKPKTIFCANDKIVNSLKKPGLENIYTKNQNLERKYIPYCTRYRVLTII